MASCGLNDHHRLQWNICTPIQGQKAQPQLVSQFTPEIWKPLDIWTTKAVMCGMGMHWNVSSWSPTPSSVLHTHFLPHHLAPVILQNVAILLASPWQIPTVLSALIVRIHLIHTLADATTKSICEMNNGFVEELPGIWGTICCNSQRIIFTVSSRGSFDLSPTAEGLQLCPATFLAFLGARQLLCQFLALGTAQTLQLKAITQSGWNFARTILFPSGQSFSFFLIET
mmetsp:Transcript_11047/g.23027  ORF Transcript_11047/g.23027 Transcript_11047/m.23027 type:complete len:227 (+) Transcript_11047:26-706(+)